MSIEARSYSETTHRAIDKVNRYKWEIRNEAGELEYVDKLRLNIDRAYQRQLNDGKRLRIAANFDWAAFGVLLVARRCDGSLWIFDGQHRHAAAMSRSDIRELPCVIFEFAGDVSTEAANFLTTQKERKPITGLESFAAQIVAKDPVALAVMRMLASTGHKAGNSGNCKNVQCIGTLYSAMARDAEVIEGLWPLIAELCDERAVDSRLVRGLFWAESRLIDGEGNKRSLKEPAFRSKLTEAGVDKIIRSIGDASAYHHAGGERIWAEGVLNVINYKRRKPLAISRKISSEEA